MTFNFRSLAIFCALATAALSAPQLIPQVSNNTAKGGPAGGGGGGGGGKKPMCPDGINKSRNLQCCFLFPILADIQANMFDQGQCGDGAHAALRLAFHDAIGFSNSDAGFGTGADGSIIIFQDVELGYAANTGLDDAVNLEAPVLARNNISASDFLHFAAAISVANCPGAAAPTFMIGRKDATAPAPDGTVPEPFDSVDTILARIEDAGLSAPDLVNLLASHSVAGADDIDPTLVGVPFDSTPSIFDTQFFIETLLKGTLFPGTSGNQGEVMSPLAGEMRLQSDAALARDPRTACLWQANVQNQAQVATNFATAFAKLQVLGQDTTNMIDCSDVIPDPMQLAFNQGVPMFPAGFNITDVEQSCSSTPFPTLPTASGPVTSVAPIPQA